MSNKYQNKIAVFSYLRKIIQIEFIPFTCPIARHAALHIIDNGIFNFKRSNRQWVQCLNSLQCTWLEFEINYKILLHLKFKSFQDHCHLQTARTYRKHSSTFNFNFNLFVTHFSNLFCSVTKSRMFLCVLTLNYKYATKEKQKIHNYISSIETNIWNICIFIVDDDDDFTFLSCEQFLVILMSQIREKR